MGLNGIGVNDTLETTEEEVFQLDRDISASEELMQNSAEIVAVRSPTLEATQNIKRKLCALPTHKRTDSLHRLFLNCVQNTRKVAADERRELYKTGGGQQKTIKKIHLSI
jgi:hypothetical protein